MEMPRTLAQRHRQAELMDDPQLAAREHERALRGLARINRISNPTRVFWPSIAAVARERRRPLRLLDVATGGGDVPLALAHRAQRAGIDLEISGADISPRAVDFARRQARRAGVAADFFERDVLNSGVPEGYDVLTCALFLHHLSQEQALELLRTFRAAGPTLLLVDDLRRCRLGLLAAQIGTHTLTRCRIVHIDGARSVRAAFSETELRQLAARAGLDGATITRHWPWRLLLQWRSA